MRNKRRIKFHARRSATDCEINNMGTREVSIGNVNKDKKEFTFTFMTDEPCDNFDLPEVCLCRGENVDLTRLKNGVLPLLFNHNRDILIGKVTGINFEEHRAVATVVFDDDEESEKIYKKVVNGSLQGVSVGYRRLKTIRLYKNTEYQGLKYERDIYLTTKWQPYEISIVSVPADPNCGIGRELEVEEVKGEVTMDLETKKTVNEKAIVKEEERAVKETEKKTEEKAAEREVKEEKTFATKINVNAEKALSEDDIVKLVRKEILERMAKENEPINIDLGKTNEEKICERAVDGLALQYGIIDEKSAVDGANQYRENGIRTIAEDCLISSGDYNEKSLRHMGNAELFEHVVGKRSVGSEQFVSVIDNFANKVMLNSYKEQPTTFRKFVSKGVNRDFKPTYKYRVGLGGVPELMSQESSEFKYQGASDARVATNIQTYGKGISLTREIFINDDMGTVVKFIQAQASGFERLKEKMFYDLLLKGAGIFTKAHGNVAEKHKDLTLKAYNEMRNLMVKQKDNDNLAYIGVYPSFLLCGTDYTYTHLQNLHSVSDPTQSNANVTNPLYNSMQVVSTPYIEDETYYLIASPSTMEGIEYTTLNGIDRPQSRTVQSLETLEVKVQFWNDFGFNLIDYRPFVKNDGK